MSQDKTKEEVIQEAEQFKSNYYSYFNEKGIRVYEAITVVKMLNDYAHHQLTQAKGEIERLRMELSVIEEEKLQTELQCLIEERKADKLQSLLTQKDKENEAKWISVDERLPENEQDDISKVKLSKKVLVVYSTGIINTAFYDYEFNRFTCELYDIVTHWMPLPPNPSNE